MLAKTATSSLGPEKGALLLIVFGALGLLAVPGGRADPGPQGAVEGVVTAPRGADRENVPVLLFPERGSAPAELTHTDANGRFAFRQVFERFHVVALPPRDSGFASSWRVDLEPGVNDFVRIGLVQAAPLEVAVTDPEGFPIPGAEVAVYALDAAGPLAADVAVTDAAGRARVLSPERAGLGVRRTGFEPTYGPAPLVGPARLVLHARP